MARPELGTKRIDPENGRKFYDLGKDPIVSPYTGTSYAPSFFDPPASAPARRAAPQYAHREEEPAAEVETEEDAETQEISLDSIEDDEDDAAKLPNDDVDGDGDDEASDETDGDDSRILSLDEDDDTELEEIARPRDDE